MGNFERKQSGPSVQEWCIGVVSRVCDAAATLHHVDPPSLDDWLKQIARVMLAHGDVLTPCRSAGSDGSRGKSKIRVCAATISTAGTGLPVVTRAASARDDRTRSRWNHEALFGSLLGPRQLDILRHAPTRSVCWEPAVAAGSGRAVRYAYQLQSAGQGSGGGETGPARDEVLVLHVDAPAEGWNTPDAVLELHVLGLLCARAHPRVAGLAEWRGELEERLTGAQKRVLPLLIAGMSDNQIAAQLGSSRYTIHDHVKAIFEKWGIRSRFELMQIWRMPGERGADRAKAATRIEQDAAPARP